MGLLVHRFVAAVLRGAGVGALVAALARAALGQDHAEVGVVQSAVPGLRDDGEAALDHVGVDHEDLFDTVEVLTTTSPVVTRLFTSSPRSTSLSSRNVRSWLAVAEPLSMTARRSLSDPARVPLNSDRSWANRLIALVESIWPCRTVLLSRMRAVVTSKLSLATSMNELPGVDHPLQVLPRAAERRTELGDAGLQGGLVDRLDGGRDVGQELLGRDRDARVLLGDLGRLGEVRLRVDLWLDLDVLLAHGGAVADHRNRIGGDLVVVVVDREVDVDPPAGQLHLLDLPDLDPAIGDLGAGEDPAGVREVRDHGVGVVEDQPVQAGVARADVRHAHQRDQHEHHQLDAGAAGDHRITIPTEADQGRVVDLHQLAHRRPLARPGLHRPVGSARDTRQVGQLRGQSAPATAGRQRGARDEVDLLADVLLRVLLLPALLAQLGERLDVPEHLPAGRAGRVTA